MTTEIRRLLDEGAARLQARCSQPRREAEFLLAEALGRTRAYLLAHAEERIITGEATDRYEAKLARRARGEPMAYIQGEKEFWSLPLRVGPEVLIPRPETERLVELALDLLPADKAKAVLDLGTGSGAIALALASERPLCRILGSDISAEAVWLAEENARRFGFRNVEFRRGDWYEAVREQRFDLIVCNPPYIADGDPRVEADVRRFEPPGALFAGADGLQALREVISKAGRHLHTGGWLLVEHGDRQGGVVRELMDAAGLVVVKTVLDLAGKERCSTARFSPADSGSHARRATPVD